MRKKNSGSETGSFGQWYRSADPDPCQHVTDPDQDSAKSLNPDQQQWIEGHIHGAFSDDINHINRENSFEIAVVYRPVLFKKETCNSLNFGKVFPET